MKKRVHTHPLDGKLHEDCQECTLIADVGKPGGRAFRQKETDDLATRYARKLVKK